MAVTKKVEAPFEHTRKYTHEELVNVVDNDEKDLKSFMLGVPTILGLRYGIFIFPQHRYDGDDTNEYFVVGLILLKHNNNALNVKWHYDVPGYKSCVYEDQIQSFPYSSLKSLGDYKEVFWKNTKNYFVNGIFTITVKGTFTIELPEAEAIEYELIRHPVHYVWKIPQDEFNNACKNHTQVKTKTFRSSTIHGLWYTLRIWPRGSNANDERGIMSIQCDDTLENLINVEFLFLPMSYLSYFTTGSTCQIIFDQNPFGDKTNYEFVMVFTEYRPKNSTCYDVIEYPFSVTATFTEEELRKAVEDHTDCESHSVSSETIPSLKYSFVIEPSDDNDESWIFLDIKNTDELKVDVDANVEILSADFSKQIYKNSDQGHDIYCCKTEDLFDPRKRFLADRKLKVQIKGVFYWYKPCEPSLSLSLAYEGFDALSRNTSGISNTLIESHISSLDAIMKGKQPCDVETTFRTFDMAQSAARCFQDQNYLPSLSVNEVMKLMDYAIDHDAKNLITKLESHLTQKINVGTVIQLANCTFKDKLPKFQLQCLSFLLDALRNRTPVYDFANLDETFKDQLATNAFRKYH